MLGFAPPRPAPEAQLPPVTGALSLYAQGEGGGGETSPAQHPSSPAVGQQPKTTTKRETTGSSAQTRAIDTRQRLATPEDDDVDQLVDDDDEDEDDFVQPVPRAQQPVTPRRTTHRRPQPRQTVSNMRRRGPESLLAKLTPCTPSTQPAEILTTRLQFAKFKLDHGWTKQNLDEVENLYFKWVPQSAGDPVPTEH